MAKLDRAAVVAAALELLDEVGLDSFTTRQLARRLGIEQPSLYWHFRTKQELLAAMAEVAMLPHASAPLPVPGEDWRAWFADNARSFRHTLLLHRDGARLHAGSRPGGNDLERIQHKMAFLVASGLPEMEAGLAMLASSRFTLGSVLEEQADLATDDPSSNASAPTHEQAFEQGVRLIIGGLENLAA